MTTLLCPFLLPFRDPTAADPDAGCRCLEWRCAVFEPLPATGEKLTRDGYCGLRKTAPMPLPAYRRPEAPAPRARPRLVPLDS